MSWKSWCKTGFALAVFVLLCGNFGPGVRKRGRSRAVRCRADLDAACVGAEGVAIRAGRLFDPRTGNEPLANQVILIQGDRISDVGTADRVKIPAGTRVIDLSSATVLPGLIDRHVHLMQNQEPNDARALIRGQHYALADLYAGFTTLQDMNSPFTYATVELRDAINKGVIVGPRLQVTGPGLTPRGATYYRGAVGSRRVWTGPGDAGLAELSENVNSPWLARAAVREHSHYGTDWIKIYETEDYEGSGYPVSHPELARSCRTAR